MVNSTLLTATFPLLSASVSIKSSPPFIVIVEKLYFTFIPLIFPDALICMRFIVRQSQVLFLTFSLLS